MARWLAENDPRATPLTDALAGRGVHLDRLPATRLENLLADKFLAYARGYLAGLDAAPDFPDWRRDPAAD